jgi:hypothetical protein
VLCLFTYSGVRQILCCVYLRIVVSDTYCVVFVYVQWCPTHIVLCLFTYSGVRQILCCVCALFFVILCNLYYQFLWIVIFDCPFGILKVYFRKLVMHSNVWYVYIISYLRVDPWALRLYHPEVLLYSLRRSRRLYSGAEGWYNLNAHG